MVATSKFPHPQNILKLGSSSFISLYSTVPLKIHLKFTIPALISNISPITPLYSLPFQKLWTQLLKIHYSTRRNMFGRIRSSPSSSSPSMVEWFEQERPPSKLHKDDSLSIFEATLMKLKQGSRRCSSESIVVSHDSMDIESSTDVSQDLSANSGVTVSGDSSFVSMNSKPSPVQEKGVGVGVSIQFLFSRYTNSLKKQGSSSCDTDPLSNVSGCSSDSESTGCSKFLS